MHNLGALKVSFPDRLIGGSPVSFLQEDDGPLLNPGAEAGPLATSRMGREVSKRAQVPGDTRGMEPDGQGEGDRAASEISRRSAQVEAGEGRRPWRARKSAAADRQGAEKLR